MAGCKKMTGQAAWRPLKLFMYTTTSILIFSCTSMIERALAPTASTPSRLGSTGSSWAAVAGQTDLGGKPWGPRHHHQPETSARQNKYSGMHFHAAQQAAARQGKSALFFKSPRCVETARTGRTPAHGCVQHDDG